MGPIPRPGGTRLVPPGRRGQPGKRSNVDADGAFLGRMLLQSAVLAALVAGWVTWRQAHPPLPVEVRPLKAPKMKALAEFDEAYKSSMLWGSYRSGLYFGMRTRTPRPLMLGLMWLDASSGAAFEPDSAVRHEAQQSDKLFSYGWLVHDGRSYGKQEIMDGPFNITVQMVKSQGPGSGYGGDWAVRVKTSLSEPAKKFLAEEAAAGKQCSSCLKPRLSLLFYIADTHWSTSRLQLWPQGQEQQTKLGAGVELVSGISEDVGPWALHLRPGPSSKIPGASSRAAATARLRYLGLRLQDGQLLVQLKKLVTQALSQMAQQLANKFGTKGGSKLWLPNDAQPDTNLAVFQVIARASAEYDLVFLTRPEDSSAEARLAALQGDALTALAAEREAAFSSRFANTFPLGATPPNITSDEMLAASQAALSNLLGSMGYFVGASRVKVPHAVAPRRKAAAPGTDPTVVQYWREALFTAVPSRSFFPRGFLWDEGFHQLLVARWDAQLSRDAMAHWLDLMNAAGWIPREQILGKEARARVPAEFLVQHPSHANPPSLFLPLSALAAAAAAAPPDDLDAQHTRAFLQRAWPRLEAWYKWFNTTQAGQLPGSYAWKGRDAETQIELNPKTLMSGLDDYPRASHPTPDERHVDLATWMACASQAMADVGKVAGAPAKAVLHYAEAAKALGSLERLQQLHYDAATGQFADWGLHTEAVKLDWVDVPGVNGQPAKRELVRVVSEWPSLQFVPSFGYVSLFPLLMQLLPPNSDVLGQQLKLLQQEQLLWTNHGLRSLAPTSSLYRKFNTQYDSPYWRGQIWVNINFLALRALAFYSGVPGPHTAAAAGAYQQLRHNLLTLLVQQYTNTGYLWEQYDDYDGRPRGSHPFTGWTALLTLAASEVY